MEEIENGFLQWGGCIGSSKYLSTLFGEAATEGEVNSMSWGAGKHARVHFPAKKKGMRMEKT